MRTTIDLPEDLYRTLKARAALSGMTLGGLLQRLIEQGLRQPQPTEPRAGSREPPPVIVPKRGMPIPAVTGADLRRLEEAEDEAKHAGPA